MSNDAFKCIYLVCIDHNNDINHVIARNPSLKKARNIASQARAKWPEKDIYISIEKTLQNPFEGESSASDSPATYQEGGFQTSLSARDLSSKSEICICGKRPGDCVGNLSCRCNALAKCKNLDFSKQNPLEQAYSWGLTTQPPEKLHRTLISVEGLRRGILSIRIPGWDPHQTISISANELPSEALNEIRQGSEHFLAKVNLGAENVDDLIIEFVEIVQSNPEIEEEIDEILGDDSDDSDEYEYEDDDSEDDSEEYEEYSEEYEDDSEEYEDDSEE